MQPGLIFSQVEIFHFPDQVSGFIPPGWVNRIMGFPPALASQGLTPLLQDFIFPHRSDLACLERAGLSLGLGVALLSILALLIDRSPWEIGFALPQPGVDQLLDILFARENYPFPYRALRIWLNVLPDEQIELLVNLTCLPVENFCTKINLVFGTPTHPEQISPHGSKRCDQRNRLHS